MCGCGHPSSRTTATVPSDLRRGILYSFTAWNPQGTISDNDTNARRQQSLLQDVRAAGFHRVYDSFACQPRTACAEGWYEEGLTVHVGAEEDTAARLHITQLAAQYQQLSVYRYQFEEASNMFVQSQLLVSDTSTPCSADSIHVVPVAAQLYPYLYPTFESAAVVLEVHATRSGATLQDVLDEIAVLRAAGQPCTEGLHPIINVEGIDGCGKSTLCASLVEHIPKAQLLQTPSIRMSHHRKLFDACDESVRRAYYSLCNYSVAHDLLRAAATGPVILDRYWHSTVAYALCQARTKGIDAPDTVAWPSDLLQPSAVLLLTVSEEERVRRMVVRGIPITQEEAALKNKVEMRQQLLQAYRSLCPTKEINGDGTRHEVLQEVMATISPLLSQQNKMLK